MMNHKFEFIFLEISEKCPIISKFVRFEMHQIFSHDSNRFF